jgi:putative transposase
MAHSYVKIWVHAVFGTKHRQNLIVSEIKKTVHQIIIDELKGLDCSLMAINSMPDHVHVLFLLNRNKNIAEIMKQVKGGSSYRIHQQDLISEKFAWQVGYGAFSVRESAIDKVKAYIKNQEMHHQKISFEEEYERFVELHGFMLNDKNA